MRPPRASMSTGYALDTLIEFAREREDQWDGAMRRAVKTVEGKANKLRERRVQLRMNRLCACTEHRKNPGEPVCKRCYRTAPGAARVRYQEQHLDDALVAHAKRQAERATFESSTPEQTNTDKL